MNNDDGGFHFSRTMERRTEAERLAEIRARHCVQYRFDPAIGRRVRCLRSTGEALGVAEGDIR